MSTSDRIIKLLKVANRSLSGAEIAAITGLWSGSLYVALYSLEARKVMGRDWDIGEYPRRRVYWFIKGHT